MTQASEHRIHVRVTTVVPCVVQSQRQVHGCRLIDLSRGGGQLESELDLGNVGDDVSLAIGLPEDERSLQAKASIMRRDTGEFGFHYGIRFSKLDVETRGRLFSFIDNLSGQSTTAQRYGRRLAIELYSKEQLKTVMRDVSEGGVGLISAQSVVIDEAVRIDVRIPNMSLLSLPGRVAYVHSLNDGQFAVGVAFPELQPETKRALDGFLDRIA